MSDTENSSLPCNGSAPEAAACEVCLCDVRPSAVSIKVTLVKASYKGRMNKRMRMTGAADTPCVDPSWISVAAGCAEARTANNVCQGRALLQGFILFV